MAQPRGFDLILQRHGLRLDPALAARFHAAMGGNALYLDLVARELAQAGALPPDQIIARVAENPDMLFSFAIERLRRLPGWEAAIGPILGLLLAARQPLPEGTVRALIGQSHLAVQDALQRLGGLVARDGEDRATLFHLKLRDFLREDSARPTKPCVFAADEEQRWHCRLADWAEQGSGLAAIWQDRSGDALEQERRVPVPAAWCRISIWCGTKWLPPHRGTSTRGYSGCHACGATACYAAP